MRNETISIEEMVKRLEPCGTPPKRVRYCEGVDTKSDGKVVSKRLFFGDVELWLNLDAPTADIQSSIQGIGYRATATQHVPDGWGKTFLSTYYELDRASTPSQ